MSKIALSGDAAGTGTFTIASPNSNNNRTLTLPDATGTVVVTGGAQTIEFAAGSASAPSVTFTSDTNTGIYSPGSDTIGITNNGIEKFRVQTNGFQAIGEDWSSTLKPAYFCRAWVNFNGTGTVAIRASGNVTSITDVGTGVYTVNFTASIIDANYAGVVGVDDGLKPGVNSGATTSAFGVTARNNANTLTDSTTVTVAIFR